VKISMTGKYLQGSRDVQLLSGVVFSGMMEAVLQKNVPFRFIAPGFSMHPFICDGDIITIEAVSGRLYSGDVVAFKEPFNGKLIVHRIVHISHEGYLIKGDNNSFFDGRISGESIIGRVIRVKHGGREVMAGLGPERFVIAWLSRHNMLRNISFGEVLRILSRYCIKKGANIFSCRTSN
jgi:signal peptidase I